MPCYYHDVRFHGALGDGDHDDTSSIVAAIKAAASDGTRIVLFPQGTYKISSSLVPGDVTLIGTGTLKSTIRAAADMRSSVVVYAPYNTSYLHGLTIDGGDQAQGNTGILASSNAAGSPYRARWGDIDILNCATGFHIIESKGTQHVYYNDFGKIEIRHVGVGLLLETEGGAGSDVNANHFAHLSVTVFSHAALQTIGTPHGIGIDYFHAEAGINGAVGFKIDSCVNIQIAAGYMEMNQPTDLLFQATGSPKGFEYRGYWTYGRIGTLPADFYQRGNMLPAIGGGSKPNVLSYNSGDSPTTIDVSQLNPLVPGLIKFNTPNAITVTDFVNASLGQVIILYVDDAATHTVTVRRDNTQLAGGVNATISADQTLTLVFAHFWQEIGRVFNQS